MATTPGTPPAPGLPPDLAERARELQEKWGFDPSTLFGAPAQEPEEERKVYMGRRRVPGSGTWTSGVQGGLGSEQSRARPPRVVDDVKTFDEALLLFNTWSDRQIKDFAERLVGEGILPADYTFDEVRGAWETFVKEAERFTAAGRKITPWDVIAYYSGEKIGGGGSDEKGQARTQTSTQFHLSTPAEARGMLSQMLSNLIGRAPSDDEVDSFQEALNGEQRRNPTTTTVEYDEEGNSTSTTTGGMDAGAYAGEYAQGEEFESEAGTYQAATTYFNALREAIGPAV